MRLVKSYGFRGITCDGSSMGSFLGIIYEMLVQFLRKIFSRSFIAQLLVHTGSVSTFPRFLITLVFPQYSMGSYACGGGLLG